MNDVARKMLSVDLAELCIALTAEGDMRWFLDLGTGDVILVTHEYDPADYEGLTVAAIEASPKRFVRVPPAEPQDLVSDMQAYLDGLTDGRLKESLELALHAPRPEKRFKAVLDWLPEAKEAWHAFRNQRCLHRAREWLRTLGVHHAEARP